MSSTVPLSINPTYSAASLTMRFAEVPGDCQTTGFYSQNPQNTPKTPYFTLKFSRFYPYQESFVYIDPKIKTDKVVPKIDKIDY